MYRLYCIIFLILGYLLLGILIPILSKISLDIPDHRSSHNIPTPTGGGLVFVSLFVLVSIKNGYWLPLYCLPLSIIGFIDDFSVNGLSRLLRFTFQIGTALFILFNSNLFNNYLIEIDDLLIKNCLLLFLLIFGLATINFTNFMDGLDGLLTLMMIILLTTLSFTLNSNILILVSLLFPFLIKNWNPAEVFMGDGGSTFLGAFLFGLILTQNSFFEASKVALLTFPMLGDAFVTALTNIFYKQNILIPHKLHLFQRLKVAGLSEIKITLLFSLILLLNCIVFMIFNIEILIISSFATLLFGFYINKKYAFGFKKMLRK